MRWDHHLIILIAVIIHVTKDVAVEEDVIILYEAAYQRRGMICGGLYAFQCLYIRNTCHYFVEICKCRGRVSECIDNVKCKWRSI